VCSSENVNLNSVCVSVWLKQKIAVIE
jgi:hypothetical protein